MIRTYGQTCGRPSHICGVDPAADEQVRFTGSTTVNVKGLNNDVEGTESGFMKMMVLSLQSP